MDQFHLMNVFAAVGEDESFAAAARRLDLSPAAISRAIVRIETQLGVKLILRTTRNVRLTEAGRRYLDDVRNILASVTEANEAVAGVNATPRGSLAVTAPVLFGRDFVMPCIVDFLKTYPEVAVSAYFLDRIVNVVEEGMDVAVRVERLPDSSLIARRVGQVRRVLCASPEYLAKNGVPQRPADLAGHTVIAAAGISPHVEWKFDGVDKEHGVCMKPRLIVSSNDAAIEACSLGLGICQLLSYQISNELTQGRLKVILADYEDAPWPVHLLHRESKFGSAKVRNFIDLLTAHLRAHPHLN